MTHGKLINNNLTLFQIGSTVKIKDNLVTNPSIEQLESDGWKEVIYHEGNNGIYEDENFIIIETIPINTIQLSPEKIREEAYISEPIIMWDGVLRTCDFCRGLLTTYDLTGDMIKYDELKILWLNARSEIQNRNI